jgi:dTDP-4-dehydrorhamnose 3,5-epimerase-like enzyme
VNGRYSGMTTPHCLDRALLITLPKNCRLHQLDVRGDARGSLIALEGSSEVPFDVARVYYIFGTRPGVERGFHAHERLTQWAICVSGSCVMRIDDGVSRVDVTLDRPDRALEIGPMIWREMHHFSSDAVLLVLASAHYDPADYIRDYHQFLAKVRG